MRPLIVLCFLAILTSMPSVFAKEAKDSKLDKVLAMQNEETKARFEYRNPAETLSFFGIEPGMTVVEALPGGGWYSKILLPALGPDGQLIGIDYPQKIWASFSWTDEKFIESRKTWADTWPDKTKEWNIADSAKVSATKFGEIPEAMNNSADAFLFIRALHNMARLNDKDQHLSSAINEAYALLKPGGIVGVVQHEARADRPDDWADGSNGYLKKEFVKDVFQKAGFEYVGEISINENPKDQANTGDNVWRLPPSLRSSEELQEAMKEIGESNRMTLKFRKPTS